MTEQILSLETEDGEIDDSFEDLKHDKRSSKKTSDTYNKKICQCCQKVIKDSISLTCGHSVNESCLSKKFDLKKKLQCPICNKIAWVDEKSDYKRISSSNYSQFYSRDNRNVKNCKPNKNKLSKSNNYKEYHSSSKSSFSERFNGNDNPTRKRKSTRWDHDTNDYDANTEYNSASKLMKKSENIQENAQELVSGVFNLVATQNTPKNITISQFKKYTELSTKSDIMNLVTEAVKLKSSGTRKSDILSDDNIKQMISQSSLESMHNIEQNQLIKVYRQAIDRNVIKIPKEFRHQTEKLQGKSLSPDKRSHKTNLIPDIKIVKQSVSPEQRHKKRKSISPNVDTRFRRRSKSPEKMLKHSSSPEYRSKRKSRSPDFDYRRNNCNNTDRKFSMKLLSSPESFMKNSRNLSPESDKNLKIKSRSPEFKEKNRRSYSPKEETNKMSQSPKSVKSKKTKRKSRSSSKEGNKAKHCNINESIEKHLVKEECIVKTKISKHINPEKSVDQNVSESENNFYIKHENEVEIHKDNGTVPVANSSEYLNQKSSDISNINVPSASTNSGINYCNGSATTTSISTTAANTNTENSNNISLLHSIYSKMYNASVKMKEADPNSVEHSIAYQEYCDNYDEYQRRYSEFESSINFDNVQEDKTVQQTLSKNTSPDIESNHNNTIINSSADNNISKSVEVQPKEEVVDVSETPLSPVYKENNESMTDVFSNNTNSNSNVNVSNSNNTNEFSNLVTNEKQGFISKKEYGYLWLSNLSSETKAIDLCFLFRKFGHVNKVKIFEYKLPYEPSYFGLVCMTNYIEAEMAMSQLQDTSVNERNIFIKMLDTDPFAASLAAVTASDGDNKNYDDFDGADVDITNNNRNKFATTETQQWQSVY